MVEWREVEGEVVALHLEKLVYLGINRSGTALWPLLVSGASKDDLVARLRDEFGLAPEEAAQQVEAFVSSLSAHDLLAGEAE